MRFGLLAIALMTMLTLCLTTSSASADVVIDLPPPPARKAPADATPNTYIASEAPARIDVGTVALVRYGSMRGSPRDRYGPSASYRRYGYGYNPYFYNFPHRYYPFVTRYHFGLGVHLHHGRARPIGFW